MRADLLRLRGYYRDHGFFEAEVDTVLDRSENGRVRVSFIVQEGPATEVHHTVITGLVLPDGFEEILDRSAGPTVVTP